ncbi:bifunctional diaminohydroxyphosphoribosylaminopyrimidine deaminase/5-amino-6-(5-phosphoribosylamino)uracil reductase RibD [Pseudochelatococcus sp. B33]
MTENAPERQRSAEMLRQRSDDLRFMRDALTLGWRQQGLTSPNPAVGAVIVRQEGGYEGAYEGGMPVVLGRGATQAGGRPHGEPIALAMAGEAARGATLYVTLEPCSHHGRAGPCSDAVIAAGIARVVSSMEDPDPRVAGQGHARLRAAGVTVDIGILAEEAARAHRGHVLRVTQGRPAVTLKLARTADGVVASGSAARLLITGPAANDQVHLLRAHTDAILVGAGTVLADDPLLTVRLPGLEGRSPIRVVLDSRLRISPSAKLVTGVAEHPTWIITTDNAPAAAEEVLRRAGAEVIRVEDGPQGRVSPAAALAALARRGVARVLVEGGPELADALVAADLVDEVLIVTAPGVRFGNGADAAGTGRALGSALAAALDDPARFRSRRSGLWGPDTYDEFERFS